MTLCGFPLPLLLGGVSAVARQPVMWDAKSKSDWSNCRVLRTHTIERYIIKAHIRKEKQL